METKDSYYDSHRRWHYKFRDAGRGIAIGIRSGNSFAVHLFFTAAVIAAAVIFHVDRIEWCLLVLCIGSVLAAEYLNSGLESLAKVVTRERNPLIRDALDMGSGGVLIMSIGAVIVGMVVFVPHLLRAVQKLP